MRGKMNKLHIYTICIIIGYTIAGPVSKAPTNQLREIVTIAADNPGLVSRDEGEGEFTFQMVDAKNAAQTKDVLAIDELIDGPANGGDDLELAETHIFRPLFRYRAQLEKRERVRKESKSKS